MCCSAMGAFAVLPISPLRSSMTDLIFLRSTPIFSHELVQSTGAARAMELRSSMARHSSADSFLERSNEGLARCCEQYGSLYDMYSTVTQLEGHFDHLRRRSEVIVSCERPSTFQSTEKCSICLYKTIMTLLLS